MYLKDKTMDEIIDLMRAELTDDLMYNKEVIILSDRTIMWVPSAESWMVQASSIEEPGQLYREYDSLEKLMQYVNDVDVVRMFLDRKLILDVVELNKKVIEQ